MAVFELKAYKPRGSTNDSIFSRIKSDFRKNYNVIIMAVPIVLWYLIFHYLPMYGVIIAFKDFSPATGILGSDWVGLQNFVDFFSSPYFVRVLRNTLLISGYQLIFGFPAPIILALLLNELKSKKLKATVQTITYLPHFLSSVVLCGLVIDFLSKDGLINSLIASFGGTRTSFLLFPQYFRTVYVSQNIWQGIGWSSILYLAALSNIDTELYEAVVVDGANRFRRLLHITLPGITPTIVVLLILNMGRIMSEGAEKIILLYNSGIYETADIISSLVYRVGITQANYSYSSAVGLFNAVINVILLVSANQLSKKVNETSLW